MLRWLADEVCREGGRIMNRAQGLSGALVVCAFGLSVGSLEAEPQSQNPVIDLRISAEPEAALIDAIKSGDTETAATLVGQGVDVNQAEPDGTTGLHWAAHLDDAEAAALLIGAGADVDTENRYGATPLVLASQRGSGAAVEALLEAGADANTVLGGEHVLMTAARSGSAEAVKALLANGADANFREPLRGQTALMWAAAAGRAPVVRELISAGADPSARSDGPDSVRPMGGRIRRVDDPLGIRSYRDPSWAMNQDGLQFTPLLFAARAGHIDVARALLDGGADPNEAKTDAGIAAPNQDGNDASSEYGTPALMLAIMNHHWELAALLVERGADPDRGPGFTALHQVSWSRRPHRHYPVGMPRPRGTGSLSSMALAQKLIDHGVDVDAQATRSFRDGYRNRFMRIGATAFMMSAKLVDVPMMKLLVASGADIHIRNANLDTPLLVAAGVGLHNPGEDAGTEDEVLEAVKYLIDLGFDVNATTVNNENAMHGAAYRGFPAVVNLLRDHGATYSIENIVGWKPVNIADGVFYTGFFKRAPDVAVQLREFYEEDGLPIPPPPGVNDTTLLTIGGAADDSGESEK